MKTAFQQLYDFLNDAEQNNVFEVGTQNLKRYIETIYLETEKQQIIDAYSDGQEYGFNKFGQDSEKYYNETFNNQ